MHAHSGVLFFFSSTYKDVVRSFSVLIYSLLDIVDSAQIYTDEAEDTFRIDLCTKPV